MSQLWSYHLSLKASPCRNQGNQYAWTKEEEMICHCPTYHFGLERDGKCCLIDAWGIEMNEEQDGTARPTTGEGLNGEQREALDNWLMLANLREAYEKVHTYAHAAEVRAEIDFVHCHAWLCRQHRTVLLNWGCDVTKLEVGHD